MKLFVLFIFIGLHSGLLAHKNELIFIENKGQWEGNVLYQASIKQGTIFFEKNKFTVNVRNGEGNHFSNNIEAENRKGHSYQIQFVNANPSPIVIADDIFSEYFNYFLGNDTAKWKGMCHGYGEITYKNLYPNIDMKITSSDFKPKYSFILKKGAKISDIQMKMVGLDDVFIDTKGNLVSKTSIGEVVDEKPISFIHQEGQKTEVPSSYVLNDNIVSFDLGQINWNSNQVLEIDPQIIFSTYSGSTADNFGASATYDYFGNTYGTGLVFGVGYITTTGAYDVTFNGAAGTSDIAITKFNANGTARIYSTYIGGTSYDVPHSLIVDQNNRLILLATTSSSNYPTTAGALQTAFAGGPSLTTIASLNGLGVSYPNGADIAVTKFNASGTGLLGSTFFGGNGSDGVNTSTGLVINYGDGIRGEVETDTFGNIYLATMTTSTNLTTLPSSFKKTNSGGYDGLLVKFNTTLTTMLAMTYVGGGNDDALYDMAFTSTGTIVAGGGTLSNNIPVTDGVVNSSYSGGVDGLVVKYNSNFSSQIFESYYGTADYDQVYFIDLDHLDNVYILGQTNHSATNFYNFNATYANTNKGQFISVLNPTFTTKLRTTTFGAGTSSPNVSLTAFLVDYCDKIFITGWGSNLGTFNTYPLSTTGMPVSTNAFQSTSNGNGFHMMILEGDLSALYYGSFFGGVGSLAREHVDGGTSRFDKNGIVYHAVCAGCGGNSNFPIYPNASSVVSGTNNSPNCNLGVFKFDFGLPVTADFTSQSVCAPGIVNFTNISHTVSNNAKYKWSFSNGATSTVKDPQVNFTTAGQYTATLIITDSLSCNISDTITKNVLVLGTVNDSLFDKVICPNSSVRIGFTNMIDPSLTISWTPASTLDDPTILAPFASPTVTTLYRAIVSKSGCIDTFYQRVIVEAPKVLKIYGDTSICGNTNVTYTTDYFVGGNYIWSPASSLVSKNRDTAIFNFPTLPASINVEYTSPVGCVYNGVLQVSKVVLGLALTYDSIVCKGDIVTVKKLPNLDGGSFSYAPATNVVYSSLDTVRVQVDTTSSFVIAYYISPTCNIQKTINFKLLKDNLNWTIDSVLCYNQNPVATAKTDSAYTINWQPQALLTSLQGQSPANFNLNNIDRKIQIEAKHKVKSYCKFNDSITVRFIQNSIKLKGDTLVCKGSTVEIVAGKLSNSTYLWTSGATIQSQNDSSAFFTFQTSGYVYLTLTHAGCIVKDSIFITVVDELVKTTADSIICRNDTVHLNTTLMTGAIYNWFPTPSVISGSLSNIALAKINAPQWFFVHIQDTNGCYIIDSVLVKVYDSTHEVQADFVSNTNCNAQSVQLMNNSYSVSSTPNYFWDFGGMGTSSLKNPNFSFPTRGLQNIKLIVTDPTACNKIDSIEKLIFVLYNGHDTLPELKICKLDSVKIGLQSMVDLTSTVSWVPTTRMSGSSTYSPTILALTDITYTCFISKNGCVDTLVQFINVDSPSTVKLQGDKIACINEINLYTATKYGTGDYLWTPSNNVSYLNRDSARMLINTNPQTIKVQYTSEYGCLSRDSIIVTTLLANIQVQMDDILCKGEQIPITMTVSHPNKGTIVFSPNADIISQTSTTAIYKVDTSKKLYVEYKINNLCLDRDSINITLLKDAVNWNVDTIVCQGKSTIATANTSSKYNVNWSPVSLLTSAQGVSPATFGLFAQDRKIYIKATTPRPTCLFNDSATVHLLQNIVQLQADTVACQDSFVEITALPNTGTSYTWSPISKLQNANANKAIFLLDNSRYFYVAISDNSGCTVMDSIYIRVSKENLKVWADSIVCPNDTLTLNATLLPSALYQWSTGATTPTTVVRVPQSTTYQLSVTDQYNCPLRDSVHVFTLDKNTFFIVTSDTINCAKDSVILISTHLPDIQYIWTPTQVIKSGLGTHKITAWINDDTRFIVDAILQSRGCVVSDTITIYKDTQYISLIGASMACRYDTITLTANFNPNFTYLWSPSNWVFQQNEIARYILEDSIFYYCEAQGASRFQKCKYIDSIFVDYSHYLEDLQITASPQRVEYSFNSQLEAKANNIVGYFWSPNGNLTNKYISDPIATGMKQTTTYHVTVTDPIGCRSSDSVIVDVFYEDCKEPEVFLPTGFTPNDDNKNDALFVRGDNIVNMHLLIYDRWGEMLFESKNQKKGWDGTYKGAKLEPGVFAYYLYVECIGGETYTRRGNLTLLK